MLRLIKKQKTIQIIAILLILLLPLLAKAHGLVPCGGEGEDPCKFSDIFILIARVTNWLLMMAGAFAVFKIVGAGWWMGATMGNEEKIIAQKKTVTNAVLGLVLAMMAFMIINSVVNYFFLQGIRSPKCKIELRDPMSYLRIDDAKIKECRSQFLQQKQQ